MFASDELAICTSFVGDDDRQLLSNTVSLPRSPESHLFSLQVMFFRIAELGRARGEVDADGGWLERGRVLGFSEYGGWLLDRDVDSLSSLRTTTAAGSVEVGSMGFSYRRRGHRLYRSTFEDPAHNVAFLASRIAICWLSRRNLMLDIEDCWWRNIVLLHAMNRS